MCRYRRHQHSYRYCTSSSHRYNLRFGSYSNQCTCPVAGNPHSNQNTDHRDSAHLADCRNHSHTHKCKWSRSHSYNRCTLQCNSHCSYRVPCLDTVVGRSSYKIPDRIARPDKRSYSCIRNMSTALLHLSIPCRSCLPSLKLLVSNNRLHHGRSMFRSRHECLM